MKRPIVGGSRKPLTLRSAMQAIYVLQEHSEDKTLLYDVLDTCYDAATYSESKDPLLAQRVNDSEFLEDLPRLRTAITQIRQFLSKYPLRTSYAVAGGLLEWKDRRKGEVIFPAVRGERIDLHQLLEELLACFDSALEQGLHGAKRGGWLHRVQLGALLYPDNTPVDEKTFQPNIRLNSLLFHLVFLFRQATSPNPIRAMLGAPMPPTGKPHYPLVTMLANAALPDDCSTSSLGSVLSEQQTRQRILRLQQQVKWAPWPK